MLERFNSPLQKKVHAPVESWSRYTSPVGGAAVKRIIDLIAASIFDKYFGKMGISDLVCNEDYYTPGSSSHVSFEMVQTWGAFELPGGASLKLSSRLSA